MITFYNRDALDLMYRKNPEGFVARCQLSATREDVLSMESPNKGTIYNYRKTKNGWECFFSHGYEFDMCLQEWVGVDYD